MPVYTSVPIVMIMCLLSASYDVDIGQKHNIDMVFCLLEFKLMNDLKAWINDLCPKDVFYWKQKK